MMASTTVFNIVVIGVGIAGKIRIRDLKEAESAGICLRLAGFVSRRSLDIDGIQQLELDDALQSPDVDGVVVCTEPGNHVDTVKKALHHNKHVLVEYPVALTPDKAKELYSLADEKGLVLHEENIALLTETHAKLKQKVASSSGLKSGEIILKCTYNGWVEDLAKSGHPFTIKVSFIQTMFEVFGNVKAIAASLQFTDDGFVATGDVQTANGAIIKLITERYKKKVPRVRTLKFAFEDGSVFDTEGYQPQQSRQEQTIGVFMQDMKLFAEKLQNQRSKSQGIDLSVRSLEVAVQLNQFIANHNGFRPN